MITTILITEYCEKVERSIKIIEDNNGNIEIDFWPEMFTVTKYEKQPRKEEPDIKDDIGVIAGKTSLLKSYYPPGHDLAFFLSHKEDLFREVAHCPACERMRGNIVFRLRNALENGSDKNAKVMLFMEEGRKIKKEFNKYITKEGCLS